MSLAYAVIANTLWHCLESDAAERAAAAAAKDLIDEEETTARKKKKKNKKKKEAADARSMSSARACTKSKPVHVHAIETVDDSLACSPQSDDMPSDMDENEYRLLRSMGWQRAEVHTNMSCLSLSIYLFVFLYFLFLYVFCFVLYFLLMCAPE